MTYIRKEAHIMFFKRKKVKIKLYEPHVGRVNPTDDSQAISYFHSKTIPQLYVKKDFTLYVRLLNIKEFKFIRLGDTFHIVTSSYYIVGKLENVTESGIILSNWAIVKE